MEEKSSDSEKRHLNVQLAPGLDGVEGLDANATPEEIAQKHATRVVRLVYDEYDPSHT